MRTWSFTWEPQAGLALAVVVAGVEDPVSSTAFSSEIELHQLVREVRVR